MFSIARALAGMTLDAALPTSKPVTWSVVGGKKSDPLSSGAASSGPSAATSRWIGLSASAG
jgi:hypothetical protein